MSDCHMSSSSAWGMVDSLNEAHIQQDVSLLASAPFVGVAMDESTSNDLATYLACEATFWVPKVGRQQLFMKLQLLEACDALSVTEAMVAVFAEFKIDQELLARKLIGLAADGASTFQGEFTGVIARVVSGLAPFVTGTHCPAHRLNLAAKSLDDAQLEHLVNITSTTNNHFSKSSKRMQAYNVVQKKFGLPEHK